MRWLWDRCRCDQLHEKISTQREAVLFSYPLLALSSYRWNRQNIWRQPCWKRCVNMDTGVCFESILTVLFYLGAVWLSFILIQCTTVYVSTGLYQVTADKFWFFLSQRKSDGGYLCLAQEKTRNRLLQNTDAKAQQHYQLIKHLLWLQATLHEMEKCANKSCNKFCFFTILLGKRRVNIFLSRIWDKTCMVVFTEKLWL